MMQPRPIDDILQGLLARLVTKGDLSDVTPGEPPHTILETVAEEIQAKEFQIAANRNGYNFLDPDISEDVLKERLAELPVPALRKMLPASAASGEVMSLQRSTSIGAQTLPVGATFRHKDEPSLIYRTSSAVTFNNGVLAVSGVRVVCQTPGTKGNAAAGMISQIVSAPSWLVSATNTSPLTNGTDAETKDQVQKRAAAWVASLSRTLTSSLETAALSFSAADGTRLRFAKLYKGAGYSELVVDDGSGLATLVKAGTKTSGTVPANGQVRLWHEAPATEPIAQIKVVSGGVTNYLKVSETSAPFISFHERGLVELPAGTLQPGDVWTIEGYNVYTGILSELQQELEGDLASDPSGKPGWIGAGVRVAVKPPTVLGGGVGFLIYLVPVDFASFSEVAGEVADAVVAYCAELGPGEPLYVARLIDRIMDNAKVLNVRVYEPNSNPLQPKDDVYPLPQQVIRTNTGLVSVVPTEG